MRRQERTIAAVSVQALPALALLRPDLPVRYFATCGEPGATQRRICRDETLVALAAAPGQSGGRAWVILVERLERDGWVPESSAYFVRSGTGAAVAVARLDDFKRGTSMEFTPPLVLLPAEIGSVPEAGSPVSPSQVAVRKLNDAGQLLAGRNIDKGVATAQAWLSSALAGSAVVETFLEIQLSASTIHQNRRYVLEATHTDAPWLSREDETLQVTVGPLRVVNRVTAWCKGEPPR